jgi:hypothetical protein
MEGKVETILEKFSFNKEAKISAVEYHVSAVRDSKNYEGTLHFEIKDHNCIYCGKPVEFPGRARVIIDESDFSLPLPVEPLIAKLTHDTCYLSKLEKAAKND